MQLPQFEIGEIEGGGVRAGDSAQHPIHAAKPEFLDFQAAALRRALEPMPERTHVLFTAHSLPERVLTGDPYPDQLHDSASEIARRAGVAQWAGWGPVSGRW